MFFGEGQYAACAASGVVDGDELFAGQLGAVRLEHELDHEADDVAWGVELSSSLVAGFLELADEVLEDRAHAVVVHGFGREVGIGERLGHLEQQPLAGQRFVDGRESLFLAAGEVEQDVLHVRTEPVEVGSKVLADVVRTRKQIHERILGGIVERLTGGLLEERVAGFRGGLLVFLGGHTDGFTALFKHAVEAAQQREWQDHVFVILGLVVVFDQIGYLPEKLGDFRVILHQIFLFFFARMVSAGAYVSFGPTMP